MKDSKTDYGRNLKNDGYTFQSMVFEVQSSFGTSTVSSVKNLAPKKQRHLVLSRVSHSHYKLRTLPAYLALLMIKLTHRSFL